MKVTITRNEIANWKMKLQLWDIKYQLQEMKEILLWDIKSHNKVLIARNGDTVSW